MITARASKFQLVDVKTLPKGVATHRSCVIRGRVVWAWKPLSSLARINVRHATRAEYLDSEHLARVLDARSAGNRAVKRQR